MIVIELVLDRHPESKDLPDAVTMVAMMNKVAVVGVGAVGEAYAFALMLRGSAREIALLDRTPNGATGMATDMRYRERYGVTIGLPTVVGREGAAGELEPNMSEHERRAFEHISATLREAARGIGVSSATARPG